MKNSTILVTGGAGYIGSHFVHAALDAGHTVAVLDDLTTGLRNNVPNNAAFIEGDVGDEAVFQDALMTVRPNVVAHFAGSISVSESLENPAKYYQNNTANALAAISCCARWGQVEHFVFSSTAAVYGILENGFADEEALTRPINPYGRSKLMTEEVLKDISSASAMRHVILRYFNVAGTDAKGRCQQKPVHEPHLIRSACQAATGVRPHLKIFGTDYDTPDGTCIRDFIHVSDLADIHLAALDHAQQHDTSLLMNCGNGKGYSVKEVVDAVERVTGKPLHVEDAERRPGDAPIVVARTERLVKTIGWRGRFDSIDDIVASALVSEKKLNG